MPLSLNYFPLNKICARQNKYNEHFYNQAKLIAMNLRVITIFYIICTPTYDNYYISSYFSKKFLNKILTLQNQPSVYKQLTADWLIMKFPLLLWMLTHLLLCFRNIKSAIYLFI